MSSFSHPLPVQKEYLSAFFTIVFLPQVSAAPEQTMREHLFVIRVEKVTGLTPLQSTVWGEADCYVQYSFPCQQSDPAAQVDPNLIESSKGHFYCMTPLIQEVFLRSVSLLPVCHLKQV